MQKTLVFFMESKVFVKITFFYLSAINKDLLTFFVGPEHSVICLHPTFIRTLIHSVLFWKFGHMRHVKTVFIQLPKSSKVFVLLGNGKNLSFKNRGVGRREVKGVLPPPLDSGEGGKTKTIPTPPSSRPVLRNCFTLDITLKESLL